MKSGKYIMSKKTRENISKLKIMVKEHYFNIVERRSK